MPRDACVLVVEDDSDLRESLRMLLEHRGHCVDEAGNGREALTALRSERLPAVVVLDLMMPVMSGIEFLAAARQDPRLTAVPMLVLTASLQPLPHGAQQILRKPVDLDRLLEAVDFYCQRAHAA